MIDEVVLESILDMSDEEFSEALEALSDDEIDSLCEALLWIESCPTLLLQPGTPEN